MVTFHHLNKREKELIIIALVTYIALGEPGDPDEVKALMEEMKKTHVFFEEK